jgi:hypothetical protein
VLHGRDDEVVVVEEVVGEDGPVADEGGSVEVKIAWWR